jgi:hypothetical protein
MGLPPGRPAERDLSHAGPARSGATPRRPRFWRRRLVVAVAACALVAAVASDVSVRLQLRQAHLDLASARRQLSLSLERLSAADSSLSVTADQRDALQALLQKTSSQLVDVSAQLGQVTGRYNQAEQASYLQGLNVGALQTCLGGVEQALNQVSVHDQAGAVASLGSVSQACQAAALSGGAGTGGPVYPFDFADPYLLRVGGTYYGFATNSAGGNIQVISSADLVHWAPASSDALPQLPKWAAPGLTWAPAVYAGPQGFVLYYSAVLALTGSHCIGAAVSAEPEGPYVDSSSSPLVCQLDEGGDIDPYEFSDVGGTPYLAWKSEGSDVIWSEQLDPSGTSFAAGASPARILRPDQAWESGVVEGPAVLTTAVGYYLFYSANDWDSSRYAIGVAACRSPTGPCSKPEDQPLLASQGPMAGPGGPSVLVDGQGGLWLAFHAWLPPDVGYPHNRYLYLRRLGFRAGLPVVVAPS